MLRFFVAVVRFVAARVDVPLFGGVVRDVVPADVDRLELFAPVAFLADVLPALFRPVLFEPVLFEPPEVFEPVEFDAAPVFEPELRVVPPFEPELRVVPLFELEEDVARLAGLEDEDEDDVDDFDVERRRFGAPSPIGNALPTAFTAPPAASPTVPTILPAVRPTVFTTLPASGIGCPP